MGFMQKQTYVGTFYEVETNFGTTFVPSDVCNTLPGMEMGVMYGIPEDAEDAQEWNLWCEEIKDYVEGDEIRNITFREGTLYRLSAPGYMDCTEWTTDGDSPEFDEDDDEPEECLECCGTGEIDYTYDDGRVEYEQCNSCEGTGERS